MSKTKVERGIGASSAVVEEQDLDLTASFKSETRISWKVGNRVIIRDDADFNGLTAVCTSETDADGLVTVQLEESRTNVSISSGNLIRYQKCLGCGRLDDPACGVRNKKCSGCQDAFYCGQSCQKTHWPIHKVSCLKEKGLVELDDHMSKTQASRQCGIQGIPKELQFMTSEVSMEIPDDVQGIDNIMAWVKGMFSKGNQADVQMQCISIYTKAYFSFLKTPDIVHGRCGAEAE
jgi:hypothetical protein